jgi:hypothetical protein
MIKTGWVEIGLLVPRVGQNTKWHMHTNKLNFSKINSLLPLPHRNSAVFDAFSPIQVRLLGLPTFITANFHCYIALQQIKQSAFYALPDLRKSTLRDGTLCRFG